MVTGTKALPEQPFSNLQLEILKLFADNVSEEDLKAIRRLIARYFAEKASDEADEIWKKKGFDVEKMRQEHSRTPYESADQKQQRK